MQLFSPQLERLWRHELQRVRRPVQIHYIELHRRVGLARLHAEQTVQTSDKNKHTSSQEGNVTFLLLVLRRRHKSPSTYSQTVTRVLLCRNDLFIFSDELENC